MFASRKLPEARKEARRISFGDEDGDEDEQDERDIEWPSQVVRLSDGKCLVYWQISKCVIFYLCEAPHLLTTSSFDIRRRLALLGACSAAEYDKMQGMMEFNVVLLRQGILDMLDASEGV